MPELIASLEEIRESPLAYFPASAGSEGDALRARLEDLESRRRMRIRLALSLRRADFGAFSSPELSAAAAFLRRGLPDAALPLLRRARSLAPEAPALALLEGWILLGRGDEEEAGQAFREARRLDPASAEAANGEGLAAWRSGATERAKSFFLQAAALAPDDPEPPNNLASVLLSEGNEKEALLWLERVLAAHPRFVPAKINRGVALARLGRIEEAVLEYRQALALDPGNADALYNLERSRERMRERGGTGTKQTPGRPDPATSGKP
jgi:Flp pilus assembly protein TadD